MKKRFCVFAGTTEGRLLVEFLSAQDCVVTACVATEYGRTLLTPGEGLTILEKRLDADEMTELFDREAYDLVVDATHPYAAAVTENIVKACERTNTEYLRLLREESEEVDGAVYVKDAAGAVDYLNTVDGSILLTTGSKELQSYTGIKDFAERVYVRLLPMQSSLDACEKAGVKVSHIIAMQGPFSVKMNEAMIESSRAEYLVTKDGGSTGGFAEKAFAASEKGIKMVIIGRPVQRQGKSFDEVLQLFRERIGSDADAGDEAAKTTAFASGPAQITVVGIGPGSKGAMTEEVREAIENADCLIGAKRMIEAVKLPGQKTAEAISPEKILACVNEQTACRTFTVVMSGDSGFFSGTKKLLACIAKQEETKQGTPSRLPLRESVRVLPGISSLSYFCSRLGLSYENVRTVSVHGRDYNIVPDVRENELVFVLTGGDADIKAMGQKLTRAGLDGVTMHIAERLSYPDERIVSGSPTEIEKETFDKLSSVLICNPWPDRLMSSGLPDEAFIRGEGKNGPVPMTKSEVRAICLSKLQLSERAVCWDVGAGTGSVSVEMAVLAKKGAVYAVEKNEDAVSLLERNKEKFMTENLRIVAGAAPSACEALPAPTHVFIGGSSGKILPVIELALSKNPEARIVAAAITLESIAELSGYMKEFETAEAAAVNISVDKKAGPYHLMISRNPIYIFTLQNRTQA